MRMLNYKAQNVRHQAPNTRARTKIDGNETKIIAAAEKYRAARCAKIALSGEGDWTREWRPLARTDVRCLHDDDPSIAGIVSEGRRTVSWIWQAADRTTSEDAGTEIHGLHDGMWYLLLVLCLLKVL